MKAKKIALGVLAVVVVAGLGGWSSLDKETRGFLAALPTNRDVLFWSQSQRDAAFRALDRLPILAKARVVAAGATPTPLPPGPPLKLAARRRRLHGRAAQRRAAGRARRQAAPRALRPRLRRRRALDHVLGRQVDHLDAGRRGDPRRLHPQHGRQGQRLHRRDERLGLRRRQHPPAADDDLGRALERGLRRPELGRRALQQAPARRRASTRW